MKTKIIRPYDIVSEFEKAMAEYTGSRYAVAVESCSAALFLCCLYVKVKDIPEVIIPKVTYPSVPASIVNAGGRVSFIDDRWQEFGWYWLENTNIIDSAKKLSRNMYIKNSLTCLSFHDRKILKIGRGGMILTDDMKAVEWFKRARNSGRGEVPLKKDRLAMAGWDMYMQPKDAAWGLTLMQELKDHNLCEPDPYQDLSKYKFYTEANR